MFVCIEKNVSNGGFQLREEIRSVIRDRFETGDKIKMMWYGYFKDLEDDLFSFFKKKENSDFKEYKIIDGYIDWNILIRMIESSIAEDGSPIRTEEFYNIPFFLLDCLYCVDHNFNFLSKLLVNQIISLNFTDEIDELCAIIDEYIVINNKINEMIKNNPFSNTTKEFKIKLILSYVIKITGLHDRLKLFFEKIKLLEPNGLELTLEPESDVKSYGNYLRLRKYWKIIKEIKEDITKKDKK